MPGRPTKPRVAILTSLVDFSPAYSLVGIILDQARALKRAGYEYDLLCLKSFNTEDAEVIAREGLNIKYILPQTRLVDYRTNQAAELDGKDPKTNQPVQGFETQVGVHFEGDKQKGWVGYREALEPYDTIIDHDLMFLTWHLPQNAAIRRCIDLWPEKNWLHWVHSGPSNAPKGLCYPSDLRFTAAPHSNYVYLNHSQAHDYSLMIGAPNNIVRTVYNPKDIRDIWNFSQLTNDIIDRYDLMNHQLLIVYPFSTPRWKDKGVRQLMKLMSNWKKMGVRAKLVLVNAHCNSPQDQTDVDAIEAYSKVAGCDLDGDVIMTSRFADEKEQKKLRYTVPFRTVRELVMLSNMFIFPSISECCSLIQAEASMSGKFMVLNRDFRPMLEFCTDGVMSYEFTLNNPDDRDCFEYYECVAREIWANFQADASLINRTDAITRVYNRDWIFKNQLEPLLYLRFAERKDVPAKPAPIEVMGSERPAQAQMDEITHKTEPPSALTVESPRGEIAQLRVVKPEATRPPESIVAEVTPPGEEGREPNYDDPWDGMECRIFGTCSSGQKVQCYEQAGHCLILDEINHEERKASK